MWANTSKNCGLYLDALCLDNRPYTLDMTRHFHGPSRKATKGVYGDEAAH
jgi:hypothetical protein